MKKILPLLFIFNSFVSFSQTINEINIVPRPAEMKVQSSAKFDITKSTVLVLEGSGLEKAANFLNDYLQKFYGFKLTISKKSVGKNEIILNYERMDNPIPGAYTMEVNNNGVYIAGDNETGAFYGIQTLLQLLPDRTPDSMHHILPVPLLSIKDYPRFPYRGMHLDVSRHFFPVEVIKKYIDYLAYHKFNTFHWHLTDDQGWRIEIKKYPLLTSVGGYRNGTIIGRYPGKGNDSLHYGGFYTQVQIKEVVRYATERYITIIPEIEMPGHSSAAIAAYPQLSCFPNESTKILPSTPWAGSTNGKQVQQTWGVFEDVYCPSEYTFNFLQDVLDEVMQLFPSTYIHVGGDECPKESWKRSAFCQQLIKEKNLKDEHGLQSYFIQRIEKYVNSKGRKIIGWDEILEGGIAPNATVMSWRGEDGGIAAARQKHHVIMTPQAYCYLDHSQTKNEDSVTIGGYLPVEKVYSYDPLPKELTAEQSKYILGAQGNMWTEYIGNKDKLEYMLFPRMSALSEVLWSPKENKDWKYFEKRLPVIFQRYEVWGANYSNGYYTLESSILPTRDFNGILWNLESKNKNSMISYTLNGSLPVIFYSNPVLITENAGLHAISTLNGKKASEIDQRISFNKATGKKITLKDQPSPNWPGNGAFTLVNGVITKRKLDQSSEWLGFLGKDIEAVIDLGKQQSIHKIRINVLRQEGSWIYPPASVEFFTADDSIHFISRGMVKPDTNGIWINERYIEKELDNIAARFIKVIAKNYGIIPPGKPGAGTPAWLFADEIEIE